MVTGRTGLRHVGTGRRHARPPVNRVATVRGHPVTLVPLRARAAGCSLALERRYFTVIVDDAVPFEKWKVNVCVPLGSVFRNAFLNVKTVCTFVS